MAKMLLKIRKTISQVSLFNLLAGSIGIYAGLDYVYNNYITKATSNDPLIWAMTVTLGVCSFIALLNYCAYAQSVVQDEVDRIAEAKAELEKAVLNMRRSSKPKKKRR
ncbi:hypothetical protein [Vibrio vulnificus]|uniref:hypothetical protein n=1 Tax=Vibrio vulnificus TaxID=672 RepID=UPI002231652B|nr:hypothetical protein [Vibrio vulnificus]